MVWGHAGDGNLHVNFLYSDSNQLPVVKKMMEELANFSVKLGGTLSAEHGLGRLKKEMANIELSDEYLKQQNKIREIFDPNQVLNQAL